MRAPVAQLDRASASGVEGRGFESRRVYHFFALKSRQKNNEAAKLHFTARSATSLKRRSLFFTSSQKTRSLACYIYTTGLNRRVQWKRNWEQRFGTLNGKPRLDVLKVCV